MPDFWRFHDRFMGPGPDRAIYQSTFRGSTCRKPWLHRAGQAESRLRCFARKKRRQVRRAESLGAISWPAAARQPDLRLPALRSAGARRPGSRWRRRSSRNSKACSVVPRWNVNKVIWGRFWTHCGKDVDGILQRRMDRSHPTSTRTTRPRTGAFVREHFFNTRGTPRKAGYMVADVWSCYVAVDALAGSVYILSLSLSLSLSLL